MKITDVELHGIILIDVIPAEWSLVAHWAAYPQCGYVIMSSDTIPAEWIWVARETAYLEKDMV